MLIRVLLTGAALMAATNVASATTVTYYFAGTSSGYTLTKDFTAAGGPDLTISANTVSEDGSTVTPVAGSGVGVGQWSGYGLGLKNSSTDNSHTVDGLGLNDLLLLTFDSAVKIVAASFKYAGIDDYSKDSVDYNANDGFGFFADDGDAGSSVAGDMAFLSQDIGANSSGYGVYDFTADGFADIFSTSFGFAAILDTCTRYRYGKCKKISYDSFKLKSVTVELPPPPPEVPIPAALPLLASALGIGGFLAHRRKRKA